MPVTVGAEPDKQEDGKNVDTAPLKTFPEPRGGHAAVGPEVDVLDVSLECRTRRSFDTEMRRENLSCRTMQGDYPWAKAWEEEPVERHLKAEQERLSGPWWVPREGLSPASCPCPHQVHVTLLTHRPLRNIRMREGMASVESLKGGIVMVVPG